MPDSPQHPHAGTEEPRWYAVHTMARHEKRIATDFVERNIVVFLPVIQTVRLWSDRRKKVEAPLFSCYTFVRIVPTAENRATVLRTPGVLGLVGAKGQGTAIPDQEIDSLRAVMREKVPCALHPFLATGRRVRVVGGCLHGVEGIFQRQDAQNSLVVSVVLLQRAISIRVNGYDVEPV